MIVDCIADLHGNYPALDGGDLLIVAGDLTATDDIREYFAFFHWISNQPYRKRVVIAGNHDMLAQQEDCLLRMANGDFEYLKDEGTDFDGLKIWGSPWTLTFEGINSKCTAFTGREDELADKFMMIPHDTDILITHGPPFGVLDKTRAGASVGCNYLKGALVYCFRPDLWVFGHIHESYGKETFREGTVCVNCSHVNEKYEPVNAPIRVIL